MQSAISDLEVESQEIRGHLRHIAYPVEGEDGRSLTVATTRPETMLGDTAVAVHPDDERYRDLVGRHVVLPLTGRASRSSPTTIPIRPKGTGAVKITPAHDFNDFAVGQRHGLPMPSILDRQARIVLGEIELAAVPGLADPGFVRGLEGLSREDARTSIVNELQVLGRLERIEPHTHQVPHGDRSGAVIEPLLTVQWYCDAKTLSAPAVAAVEDGRVQFVPKQWEKHVLCLDAGHTTLVHQPAAVVGAPYSGLVRPRRDGVRGRNRNGCPKQRRTRISALRRHWSRTRTCWTPGSARACGRSPPWAGPNRQRCWHGTTRPTCS